MELFKAIADILMFGSAAGGIIFLGSRLPLYAELVFTDD